MEQGTTGLVNKAAARASGEPFFTATLAAGAIRFSHATVPSHYRVTDKNRTGKPCLLIPTGQPLSSVFMSLA